MDFDNLTDQQIIDHIMNGDNDTMKMSLDFALNGIFGLKANRKTTLKLARQALKENKTFRCVFVDGESCTGKNMTESHLDLWIE